jgi:endonuclease/exonuclease/phosphatase family metal-dependent hydrolase
LDAETPEAREQAARLLPGLLAADLPWIVMGDLNEPPAGPVLAVLRDAGFTEPLQNLPCGAAGQGTYHGFSGSAHGRRMDYVLLRGQWQVEGAEILRETGPLASDHWPVRVRLVF